jgi:predicted nucleic acid-binding protein
MPLVLDASIVGCWAFADDDHQVAAASLEHLRGGSAIVPALWWFEIRNVLVVNERRGRISESDTASFLRRLAALPVEQDTNPDEAALLTLARRHRLSVYDAAYLELALRRAAALATLDTALVRAAKAEGVGTLSAS